MGLRQGKRGRGFFCLQKWRQVRQCWCPEVSGSVDFTASALAASVMASGARASGLSLGF